MRPPAALKGRKLLAVVLAVALIAALSFGLPALSNVIEKLVEQLATSLGKWAYLLVGAMAMAETAAFVGFIAPGEVTIILGGVLAGEGTLSIQLLIGIVWACEVIGDTIGFYLGRRLGRGFVHRHGGRFGLTEGRFAQVERFFASHGGKSVFLGRWIGLVRPLVPFTAGTSGMPYRRFLPYDILGAGTWGATVSLVGYIFWHNFDQVTSYAGRGALAVGILITGVVGALAAYRRLRNPDERARLAAWLERRQQNPVLRPLARTLLALWRWVLAPAWRVIGPSTRFLVQRLTPGELGIELTTLLAIAAVGVYVLVLQIDLLQTHVLIAGDRSSLDLARNIQGGVLTALAKGTSFLGGLGIALLAVIATAGFLAVRARTTEAVMLVVASTATHVAVQITKHAVDRLRPPDPIVHQGGFAYPSGHAAIAIGYLAIAVLLARTAKRATTRAALLATGTVIATLIGLSRLYLRVHYLSDVIGGWALGLAVFSLLGSIALIVEHLRHNDGQARP